MRPIARLDSSVATSSSSAEHESGSEQAISEFLKEVEEIPWPQERDHHFLKLFRETFEYEPNSLSEWLISRQESLQVLSDGMFRRCEQMSKATIGVMDGFGAKFLRDPSVLPAAGLSSLAAVIAYRQGRQQNLFVGVAKATAAVLFTALICHEGLRRRCQSELLKYPTMLHLRNTFSSVNGEISARLAELWCRGEMSFKKLKDSVINR